MSLAEVRRDIGVSTGGFFMKKLSAALLGVVILSTALFSAATPAFALGGCGRDFHRDAAGRCVWGGQDQAWCLRHTGHPAVPGPNGTWWCYR
jgi:hypothetical protein